MNEAHLSYNWPGNARELRNVIERATILCGGGLITLDHLPTEVKASDPAGPRTSAPGRGQSLELVGAEKQLILDALERAGHNLAEAARLLGISRPNLHYKMKKFGLSHKAKSQKLPPGASNHPRSGARPHLDVRPIMDASRRRGLQS